MTTNHMTNEQLFYEWEKNPEPEIEGKPQPDVIFEVTNQKKYLWSTKNEDMYLEFSGKTLPINQ